jgi:hypothetical protein
MQSDPTPPPPLDPALAARVEEDAVSPANLLARGYREFPDTMEKATRLFQKAFDDAHGRRYFITFREWAHPILCQGLSYDAEIAVETGSSGYVWATIKEGTISATEERAEVLWAACGEVYYEVSP